MDRPFGGHPNMKGHTGSGLSMGRRFPINISTKQQLMQTVAVDGVKTSLCWSRNFMVEQGSAIKQNIAIQDN